MSGKQLKEPGRRLISPLWVISLFVSLTEVVTGIAVTQAEGGVQISLTAFVIAFPLLVAAAFFVILWDRPHVFYPPSEYGTEVDVKQFAEAMRSSVSTDKRESAFSQDETGERIRAFVSPPDRSLTDPEVEANRKKVRDWIDRPQIKGLPIANFMTDPELKDLRERAIRDIPIP